ncbi:hypothetical protein NMY22_g9484 [Coprinellus aureogranulatus]|nr:hypothetical protein NMY22_g9484 [Coprinellus aureogranulatus]
MVRLVRRDDHAAASRDWDALDAPAQLNQYLPLVLRFPPGKAAQKDPECPSKSNGARGFRPSSPLYTLLSQSSSSSDSSLPYFIFAAVLANGDCTFSCIKKVANSLYLSLNSRPKVPRYIRSRNWIAWLPFAPSSCTRAPRSSVGKKDDDRRRMGKEDGSWDYRMCRNIVVHDLGAKSRIPSVAPTPTPFPSPNGFHNSTTSWPNLRNARRGREEQGRASVQNWGINWWFVGRLDGSHGQAIACSFALDPRALVYQQLQCSDRYGLTMACHASAGLRYSVNIGAFLRMQSILRVERVDVHPLAVRRPSPFPFLPEPSLAEASQSCRLSALEWGPRSNLHIQSARGAYFCFVLFSISLALREQEGRDNQH